MDAKVIEVLESAAALLCDGRYWTQGTLARDNAGEPVSPVARRAERWSLLGALDMTAAYAAAAGLGTAEEYSSAAARAVEELARVLGLAPETLDAGLDGAIQEVNDLPSTSHEDVLEVIDSAATSLGTGVADSVARMLLLRAYGVLEDPANWVQGAVARDHAGREVHPMDPEVVGWSLVGALEHARAGEDLSCVELAREALARASIRHVVQSFNDHATWTEVQDVVSRLIEHLRGQPR